VIDQSGASLDRLFRKSSKMADKAADVHRFGKWKWVNIVLIRLINSVIKQLQSCVEVDMRFNGPKKAISTTALVDIAFLVHSTSYRLLHKTIIV